MKKLLTILCLVLLVSCSPPPEVPSNQLVERQGITYQVNSEKPFTGTSVEYYIDTIIKDQFEDRVLWKRTTYKDGWLDGLSESFHPNSQTGIRENYKLGLEHGLHEVFYENGQLKETGNFINGEKDGLWEAFDERGQLTETTNYKIGNKDALQEIFLGDFTKIRENYKNGELDLYERFYNFSLQLEEMINYKKGKKDGANKTFYENGILSVVGNYIKGKKDGLWTSYYENNQVKERINYKDGELDGLYESYYENNQVKERINYKKGKKDGAKETFYENGILSAVGNYKDGLQDGPFKEYQENGELLLRPINTDKLVRRQGIFYEINSTIPFKGIAEHYAENIIIKRVSLIDGRSNGPIEVFHPNGQWRYKGIYKHGKRIGKVPEHFDKNGELSSETHLTGRLIDLNEEVEHESFHTNGKIKNRSRDNCGWPNGCIEMHSETYYENGQKNFIMWWKKDFEIYEAYKEDGSLRFRFCSKPGGNEFHEDRDKKGFDECMEEWKRIDTTTINHSSDSRIIGEDVSELTYPTPYSIQLTGEEVYNSACIACHMTGAGGSPPLGDVRAWSARVAQGVPILVQRAIEGYLGEIGIMPPKGGRLDLSDAEVTAAVIYMLDQL